MARKKNKKNSRAKRGDAWAQFSSAEMLNRGKQYLEQSKFKDAITCCKKVLKNKDSVDETVLLSLLEKAYTGRIRELAGKGMLKEAFVLLGNMVRSCPGKSTAALRLTLLVRSGQYVEVAREYQRCKDNLTTEQRQRMEVLLGAFLLQGEMLSAEQVDLDARLLQELPLAQEAVRLFSSQEADALRQVLGKISFRSPFKDLRLLLAGATLLDKAPDKAREMLSKIVPDSPYFFLASGFLTRDLAPKDVLAELRALPKKKQQAVRQQYAIAPKTFAALQELAIGKEKPEAMLVFIQRYKSLFSESKWLLLHNNILVHLGRKGARILSKAKLPLAEKSRLMALLAQQNGDNLVALDFWEEYLESRQGGGTPGSKEQALVLRYMATLITSEIDYFTPDSAYDLLRESLEHDPLHAETWLEVARLEKKRSSKKQYYATLNEAVRHLPDNVNILLVVMQAAAERGAFKKAARFAQKILDLDPINTGAQDFVVASHLDHGRKLALQKKWHLAEKELLAAGTRVKSIRFRGRNYIGLGMVRLLQRQEQGLEDIRVGQEENGSALLGSLLTSLEARLYQVPRKWRDRFDRELKQAAAQSTLSRQESLRIFSWLSLFPEKQQVSLRQACQELTRYFSRVADLDWDAKEGLSLCRKLAELDMHAAVLKCARNLGKKYPARDEFTVWQMVAGHLKRQDNFGGQERRKIVVLFDALADAGQYDFVDDIMEFLGKRGLFVSAMGSVPDFLDEEGFGEDDFLNEVFKMPDSGPESKAEQGRQERPKIESLIGRQLSLFGEDT